MPYRARGVKGFFSMVASLYHSHDADTEARNPLGDESLRGSVGFRVSVVSV